MEILILEDDLAFLDLLKLRLSQWKSDAKFTTVHSIKDAKALLAKTNINFDLVILDQQLPDGYGYEIAAAPQLKQTAILAVSADTTPELPAATVLHGAHHFLDKRQVSAPLFIPLVEALVERKKLELELQLLAAQQTRIETIRTLIATLKHEINNPLGAVLGAVYLLKTQGSLDSGQTDALQLIEKSGKRINHVINQLCETVEVEEVAKAHERVYHVPGDTPWEDKNTKK